MAASQSYGSKSRDRYQATEELNQKQSLAPKLKRKICAKRHKSTFKQTQWSEIPCLRQTFDATILVQALSVKQ